MHFSIPSTSTLLDSNRNPYTCYSVNINGSFHCLIRYRQLHALHRSIRREFPTESLPPFPPKKLLHLNPSQIEARRAQLERYLQQLSQDPRIVNCLLFNGFLLAAQQETSEEKEENVQIDVFLMNDKNISIKGSTILQSEQVLERICKELEVPDELVFYFSLFFVQRSNNNEGVAEFSIVKKLQDFESPYISQKSLSGCSLKLVLRKSCWDPQLDDILLDNVATLNLLYVQTVCDVERGWVKASTETKKELGSMQARGAKKEYMETARLLPYFGYVHFGVCLSDYPSTNTTSLISIGRYKLVLRMKPDSKNCVEDDWPEKDFDITRMRCWRIMTLPETNENKIESGLELGFEYLMNNKTMQWITILSPQAIFMSLCLQSMVEELLRIKHGVPLKKAGEESCSSKYVFTRRDGSTQQIDIRSGLHSHQHNSKEQDEETAKIERQNLVEIAASVSSRPYSVKKLSDKFRTVNMRQTLEAAEDVFIENKAFINIALT